MDPARYVAVTVAVLLVAAGIAVPAAADVATPRCLAGDPPEPRVGDGPWVGDAPDDRTTRTATASCYTGKLRPYDVDPDGTGPDDRDTFRLTPVHPLYWVVDVQVTSGCGDVTFENALQGGGWTQTMCSGDRFSLVRLDNEPVDVTFHDGNMSYAVRYGI